LISSRAEFELSANQPVDAFQALISRRESELREEGIGGVVGNGGMCSIYKHCGRKTCVKSIEIESGASHPPAGEASVSNAKRLYWRVGRGFY
jgi:hypothetical protein